MLTIEDLGQPCTSSLSPYHLLTVGVENVVETNRR